MISRSIRDKVTGAIVIPVLIGSFLIVWLSFSVVKSITYRKSIKDLEKTVAIVDRQISSFVDKYLSMADFISGLNFVKRVDRKKIGDLFINVVKADKLLFAVYLGTEKGEMIEAKESGLVKFSEDYDPRTRPWYREAVRSYEAVITQPYRFMTEPVLGITFAKQVFDRGKRIGVIGIDITLSELCNEISKVKVGETGFIVLMTSSGEVIASGKREIYKGETNGLLKLDSKTVEKIVKGTGTKEMFQTEPVNLFGEDVVVSGVKNPRTGWIIAGCVPYEEIMKPVRTIILLSVISSLTILLSVAILTAFMIGRIVKPVMELTDAVVRFSLKDFSARVDIKRNDEIGELAKAFNNMADEIQEYSQHLEELVKERTEELEKANERLKELNDKLERRHKEMLKELHLAQRLQQAILPSDSLADLSRFVKLSSVYLAMESIGGDLYDVYRLSNSRIGVLVADVAGHGVPAAMLTTMTKLAFTNSVSSDKPPDVVCEEVNRALSSLLKDSPLYITAFYGVYDAQSRKFFYSNAGHRPPMLFVRRTEEVVLLKTKGPFLGSFDDADYETMEISLESGDRIVFYTDGVIEAINSVGEPFGEDRLREFIRNHSDLPSDEFVRDLLVEIEEFIGGETAKDDITIVALDVV